MAVAVFVRAMATCSREGGWVVAVLRRAVYSLVHAFGEHNLAPAELVAPRIAARIAAFSHFHE